MMPSEITRAQIDALTIDPHRPLVLCDVDEVVVHFTRDFEDFLAGLDMWLDAASMVIDANIRRRSDGAVVPRDDVIAVIDRFFVERTADMRPIDGAVECLTEIAGAATLIFLSNLPHTAGDDRRINLRSLGLHQPLVTNDGPKGPAIRALTAKTRGTSVFIDDSPGFIASAREHAPEVHLVHFMHDARFARHVTPFDYLSLFTGDWATAHPHVMQLVTDEGRHR